MPLMASLTDLRQTLPASGTPGYSVNELEREHGNGHEHEHGNGHELEHGNGHELELWTKVELGR